MNQYLNWLKSSWQVGAVFLVWLFSFNLLQGQIQKHTDKNTAVGFGSFSWVAPVASFPKIEQVNSIVIQGYIPSAQQLTIVCNKEVFQVASFKTGYFILEQNFANGCSGVDLIIQSSYKMVPAETVGSKDQRVLSYKIGLMNINGKNVPIDQMVSLGAGLYGAEENIDRITVQDILTHTHDSHWYFRIARDGYSYNGDRLVQQTVAWPFLYPYLVKFVRNISGGSFEESMILVSAVTSFAAMLGLFFLGKQLGLSTALSFFAPTWFALNPFSFFVFAGFSESIFMLLFSIALILIITEKWYFAAVVISAMAASRFVGGILIVFLMASWWSINYRYVGFSKSIVELLKFGLISVAGIVIDSGVKFYATGEVLAAFMVRSAWTISPFELFYEIFDFRLIKNGEYLPVLFLSFSLLVYSLFIAVHCLKEGNRGAAIVSGSGGLIFITTLMINPEVNSLGRYALVLAPCICGLLCFVRFKEGSIALISVITAMGAAFSGVIISNIYVAAAPF